MATTDLLCSVEVSINRALKRINEIDDRDKKSLYNEFREWIEAIESDDKNYDVLFINKISN